MGVAGARLAASALGPVDAAGSRQHRTTETGGAPQLATGFGSFTLAARTAEASLSLPLPPASSRSNGGALPQAVTDSVAAHTPPDAATLSPTARHGMSVSPIHMPMPAPAPVPRLPRTAGARQARTGTSSDANVHRVSVQVGGKDATESKLKGPMHVQAGGSVRGGLAQPAASARRLRRRSMLLEDEQADVLFADAGVGSTGSVHMRSGRGGAPTLLRAQGHGRVSAPHDAARHVAAAVAVPRRRRGSRHGGVLSADGDIALDAVPVPSLASHMSSA